MGVARSLRVLDYSGLMCAADLARVPGPGRGIGFAVCKFSDTDNAGTV